MMRSDIVKEFVAMIEAEAQNRPSTAEFEMAYQARVAMDRIRFAIKVTEMGTERCEPLREAGMQLLDALQGSKRQSADSRIDGVLRVIRSRETPISGYVQRMGLPELLREVLMLNLVTESTLASRLRVSLGLDRWRRLERRGPPLVKVGALVRCRPEDSGSWVDHRNRALEKGGAQ